MKNSKMLHHKPISEVKTLAEKFLQADEINFDGLKHSSLPEKVGGVYLIIQKESCEIFYVGRTSNLKNRIYMNYYMGNRINVRSKKYLVEDTQSTEVTTYLQATPYIR